MNRTPLLGAPVRAGSGTYFRTDGSHTNVLPNTDAFITGISAVPVSDAAALSLSTTRSSPGLQLVDGLAGEAPTSLSERLTACRLPSSFVAATRSMTAIPAWTRSVSNDRSFGPTPSEHAAAAESKAHAARVRFVDIVALLVRQLLQ